MTLEEFAKMGAQHDLTYNYTDDGRVWRLGQESYDRVVAAAKQFPRADVVRIWNQEVDRKLVDGTGVYWK